MDAIPPTASANRIKEYPRFGAATLASSGVVAVVAVLAGRLVATRPLTSHLGPTLLLSAGDRLAARRGLGLRLAAVVGVISALVDTALTLICTTSLLTGAASLLAGAALLVGTASLLAVAGIGLPLTAGNVAFLRRLSAADVGSATLFLVAHTEVLLLSTDVATPGVVVLRPGLAGALTPQFVTLGALLAVALGPAASEVRVVYPFTAVASALTSVLAPILTRRAFAGFHPSVLAAELLGARLLRQLMALLVRPARRGLLLGGLSRLGLRLLGVSLLRGRPLLSRLALSLWRLTLLS